VIRKGILEVGKVESQVIGEWVFRERKPSGKSPHRLLLMLHGWTGDENSMSVFGERMPEQYWLVAPRGIYPSPSGGFSWFLEQGERLPWVDDFRSAIEALFELLVPKNFPGADLEKLDLMGFSQGAALAYALAFLYPQRVRRLAGLAGFLPEGCEALSRNQPLKGKQVYVAHGKLDKRVPVEKGCESARVLKEAGGDVAYCESEVGHKLSAGCFKGLKEFFEESPIPQE